MAQQSAAQPEAVPAASADAPSAVTSAAQQTAQQTAQQSAQQSARQAPTVVYPTAPPGTAPAGGFSTDVDRLAAIDAGDVKAGSHAIRVTTRLVSVDVSVTGKHGAPIRGLRQQDFTVLENGRPQSIRVFEPHTGGGLILPGVTAAAVPGTATNAGQDANTPALHAILFDALNTAPSDQSFARSQLLKVVADLPPGSRVALFVLRSDLHMLQGFTTDTALLLASLKNDRSTPGPWFNDPEGVLLSGVSGAGASIAEQASGNVTPGSGSLKNSALQQNAARDEASLQQVNRNALTMSALDHLTSYLAALPGRKNLLWIAGTFPVNLLPDTSGSGGDLFRDTQSYNGLVAQMAKRMQQFDIAIYPIDAQGFAPSALLSGANNALPSASDMANEFAARYGKFQLMDDIAYQTGGHATYQNNDLKGAIIETLNQGSEYYTLAYTPENDHWDGKYRKISVKVAGAPVTLAYRHGYLAADPAAQQHADTPTARFVQAMLRGAPERAEVVMTVAAHPTGVVDQPRISTRDSPAPRLLHAVHSEVYKVECKIDAKTLAFAQTQGGTRSPGLAIVMLAYDSDGKLLDSQKALFNPALPERQYDAVLAKGLTLSETLQLPAGRAFLRIGVHDLESDHIGTVEFPVVVAPAKS